MSSSLRTLALLLLFGATVGTLLDAMHTFSGTTEYTSPFVLHTAWWVPLLFASAYGFGGFAYAHAYQSLRGRAEIRSWTVVSIGVAWFALIYATSAYLPASNAVKLAVLSIAAIASWAWLDRTPLGVALATVAAIAGPLTEIALSSLGLFRHRQPDFAGIPVWLPALYFAAGPTFGQFARRTAAGEEPGVRRTAR